MRKPESNVVLIAWCTLLKMGKTLAVGDVLIYSEGKKDAVARATLTYAIPLPKST
jgi:acyl-coenzyme A thioesterase PaaI-like protein